MNPEIIPALIFVIISIIGLAKRHREIFLLGYFLYGILVFGAEISSFISTQEPINLFVAFIWLIQAVLAFPNKYPYDSPSVKDARIKICIALSLINTTGVLIPEISPEPQITLYIHLIMAILPLMVVGLLSSGKIEMEK
ncbi:MAG: hypothetical protein ACKVH2_07210 [Flavobacteriales bacterium]|tara:strand:+ start:628 stop:1044 length:417 start_codon:yes stop_codon:yes gene_type:complete